MSDAGGPGRSDGPLWRAMQLEQPLQIAGAINAYFALLAQEAGFGAIYLSGAGVANASFGLPDLGLTKLEDVVADVGRISGASSLPLLVDADTGWDQSPGVAVSTRRISAAGAAGMHLEDQVAAKRCGHRAGKRLISSRKMAERIAAAVDARTDEGFVIMARTDAASVEGVPAAIDRAGRYVEAGADMIFAEALERLEDVRKFTDALRVPIMVNLTEFGRTPLFSRDEMRDAGAAVALYPLSAFRAAGAAARRVYNTIRRDGTQKNVLEIMQTRDDLYRVLGYEQNERRADRLLEEQSDGPREAE
jgi:methylisocitrate lyase